MKIILKKSRWRHNMTFRQLYNIILENMIEGERILGWHHNFFIRQLKNEDEGVSAITDTRKMSLLGH